MNKRAYLSNISPLWPISRQEELIDACGPVEVFQDILSPKERKGHGICTLKQRQAMLRPSCRDAGEIIYVAALAVLAWSAEDLLVCLTLANARGAIVEVLDCDLSIPPGAGSDVLHEAVKAFAASRQRDAAYVRGKRGGETSGAQRAAQARAKAETVRAEWALPSDLYRTVDLLVTAGLSRNTIKLYLGPRDVAQKTHQASLKRAATKRAKSDAKG